MFITIGNYCYNTDQIKCFGLDTSREQESIIVELIDDGEDEVEFDSHEEALANFHHALKQLNLITYDQTKEEKDLNSYSAIEFLRR